MRLPISSTTAQRQQNGSGNRTKVIPRLKAAAHYMRRSLFTPQGLMVKKDLLSPEPNKALQDRFAWKKQ
jgi:hypothetical protein